MALSLSLCELIPCKEMIKKIGPLFGHTTKQVNTISTIFEDNKSAIELAMCPKMRPQTKDINVKYHHFCSHVGKTITVVYCPGKYQITEILTELLKRELFFEFRKAIMGW